MSDVSDIRDHPKYEHVDDTSPEKQACMEYLDAREIGQVGEVERPPEPAEPSLALSICVDCQHFLDRRPLWRRWSKKPAKADEDFLVCRAHSYQPFTYYVTGETFPRDYYPCWVVNTSGTCQSFRLRGRPRPTRK